MRRGFGNVVFEVFLRRFCENVNRLVGSIILEFWVEVGFYRLFFFVFISIVLWLFSFFLRGRVNFFNF